MSDSNKKFTLMNKDEKQETPEPFTLMDKKEKPKTPESFTLMNKNEKQETPKPFQVQSDEPFRVIMPEQIENPRLHKALTEMVYNFLKKESPDKDPDSKERTRLINATVNLIKPVVLANSQSEPRVIAEEITKVVLKPNRGEEKKDTDAGLVAWEIRNTNDGHSDETIANGKFVFKGLIDKLIPGIKEHLVVIRNAKINKTTEPEKEPTPFEKEFKEMLVKVIAKTAEIKPGTEQSEIMANNIVKVAGPLFKEKSDKLKNPDEIASFLAENLLEPKEKGNLHTAAGQVSYDLYYQARKVAPTGDISPDWAIKNVVAKSISTEIKDYEKKNPGKLMAMINAEKKQGLDQDIAQIGSQLNNSGVTDGDKGSSLFQNALPPISNGFTRK